MRRLIPFLAALLVALASAAVPDRAQAAYPKTAPLEFFSGLNIASGRFASVSASRVWEKSLSAAKSASDVVSFTFADDLVSQTRYDEQGNPSTAFVQMDGFGSTRWVTDQSGQITDSIDYDAFGVEIGRSGATEVEHLYRGEAFDDETGLYYLRARWMNPSVGRFVTQDTYMGKSADPASLHKYMYGNADPVNGIDPSGHATLIDLGKAMAVGAVLGAIAVPVHNYAIGKATTVGDVAMGASIGAGAVGAIVLAGPAAPLVAIPMVSYGVGYSGAMTYDVMADPGKTWGQKVSASALMLAAVAGPAYATRYSGSVWGGPKSLNDKRVLHDLGASSVKAFWESHGFKVCVECYVRNPHHKVGRRYDLIVRDTNGDYIGIEYKGTQWAAHNPPARQVRADGWIEANGGEIFGASASEAGFVGGRVTKVINLGPDTAARP